MSKSILGVLLGVILFSACKDDKVEDAGQQFQENFLLKTDFGVYSRGSTVFVYQAGERQLAFTADGLRCRIQTDNQEKYIALELSEKAVSGQMIKVRCVAEAIEGINNGEQLCQVLRNAAGKCWLWNPDSAIGYLVKTEE